MLRVLSLCAAIIKDKTTVTSTAQRLGGVNDLLSDMGHVLVANLLSFIAKQTCTTEGGGDLANLVNDFEKVHVYGLVVVRVKES